VLRAEVADVLRSLGDTEDEVVHRLKAAGVRGRPGKGTDCALAVYLSSVVGADARVRKIHVGPVRVFIEEERPGWFWPWVGVPLRRPLRSFVEHFDRLAYPALVRPTAGATATMRTPPR
jgi:hypothetical protein